MLGEIYIQSHEEELLEARYEKITTSPTYSPSKLFKLSMARNSHVLAMLVRSHTRTREVTHTQVHPVTRSIPWMLCPNRRSLVSTGERSVLDCRPVPYPEALLSSSLAATGRCYLCYLPDCKFPSICLRESCLYLSGTAKVSLHL